MFNIKLNASQEELEEVFDFLKSCGDIQHDFKEKLWIMLGSHPNVSYEIWRRFINYHPNECWDNPVIDFFVLENPDFFVNLYPLRKRINEDSIAKSSVLQACFYGGIFVKMEKEEYLKTEFETAQKTALIEAETSKYDLAVGDKVKFVDSSQCKRELQIIRFEIFKYKDGEKVDARLQYLDNTSSETSATLERLQKVK